MTATKSVTVNADQGLYVIPSGNGYTCLGFEVADTRARSLAEYTGDTSLVPTAPKGTLEHYAEYEKALNAASEYSRNTATTCSADLTPQLTGLVGKRVEVVDCNNEVRRFIVGKSMGWFPVHLEIKRRNSMSGSAVYGTPFKSVKVVG